jgi:MoaA/NifB/PqqE/SkfB family radical SAM enzyme
MPERIDLKLGFTCNNNCRHCVAADKRKLPDRTTEEVLHELREARSAGASEVVLTGGEPTIRKDIFEIISYAKSIGYKLIQLQTNARMLSYPEFAEKIIKAGVNEVVPAIHAHKADIHNRITRVPGSFEQTVRGIKNVRKHKVFLYTNTVVTKLNYKILPELTEFVIGLGADHYQFAFVHPSGNAYEYYKDVVPRISEAATYIQKALDIGRARGIFATVEAVPFCLMLGYEEHALEIYIPPTELRDVGRTVKDFNELRRTKGRKKGPDCARCRYDLVCEGTWREYPEKMGFDEFKPVPGEKIRNAEKLKRGVKL